jgi:hypothetical protein
MTVSNLDLKNNLAFNLDGNQELFKLYEQEYLKIALWQMNLNLCGFFPR